MMKTFSILLFLSFVHFVSAQQPVPNRNNAIGQKEDAGKLSESKTNNGDDTVYRMTDVRPEFPGGQEQFFKFVSTNFVIPDEADEFVKVFVSFIVEKDGSLTDIKVIRDSGYGSGREAVRILKNSPKWKPALNKDKPVRYSYMLPINIVNRKEPKNDDNTIYNTVGVEVQPTFPGGLAAFFKFVSNNFEPNDSTVNGKVFVTFVVEKDGALSDIKIIRDIGFGSGAEVVRVLKMSPKWNPGELNSKKVRVLYSLPISIGSK